PFSENCAVKGPRGGVSCRHYLVACHVAAGAIEPIDLPALPVEVVRYWHQHHALSQVLEFLQRPELRGRVRRVDEAEAPMIGDIVVLRIEQTEHHLAIWGGAKLWHVTTGAGALYHTTTNPKIMELVRAYYRILEA